MRRVGSVLVLCLIAALQARSEVNRIVLRVNDRIATTYDYQIRRAESIAALRRAQNLTPEELQEALARVGEKVMSELFDELLVLSRADQLGVAPTSSAVANAVEQTKASFGIESAEDFQAALASNGMTLEQFREQMRKNLMLREVMNREVQPRVELEEEDLRRYYQSHRDDFEEPERLNLREVIVLESSGADARRMAELAGELREQLLSGKKLDEAVVEYAEKGLVTQPVDLGWVEIGDLDQDLEEAVWGLAVGEVSTPILARGGLHLIQVAERQEARLKPFSEVQQEIELKERQRKYQEEVREYMDELEARSYIVANPPPEAAGFRRAAALRADTQAELDGAISSPGGEGSLAPEPVGEVTSDQDDGPP